MHRIERLLRPAPSASWKAALPMLGAALLCLAATGCAVQSMADKPPVQHIDAKLDFSSCAKPSWPKASLRNEETGTVTMVFEIAASGKVTDAKITRSSGHQLLDEAARDGIRQCHFQPATDDGVPVASSSPVQYVWVIK